VKDRYVRSRGLEFFGEAGIMTEKIGLPQSKDTQSSTATLDGVKGQQVRKKAWKSPTLEDVSAKIMAQPYIRFT
jgi:hypothetical protein